MSRQSTTRRKTVSVRINFIYCMVLGSYFFWGVNSSKSLTIDYCDGDGSCGRSNTQPLNQEMKEREYSTEKKVNEDNLVNVFPVLGLPLYSKEKNYCALKPIAIFLCH